MKLLFLAGNFPFPPTDGWRIRVFAILRGLARRHEVSVVSFIRRSDDRRAVDELRSFGVDVHVLERDPRYSPVKLVAGLLGPTAFPILNYRDPRMTRLVQEVVHAHSFDLVQVESLQMAQYGIDLDAATILDLHNIESLLMKRYAEKSDHLLKRAYAEVTWRKMDAYEREICGRFTHCLTCSDADRRFLVERSPVNGVTVIPNGVDVPETQPVPGGTVGDGTARPRLVFVGRMDYHANVDGIQWFVEQVLPQVRATSPDVLLQIVGGHPAPAVSRLARTNEIEVTGFVPDVTPFVENASVVVVPLRIGGGTRLKILEALAMGKAIVTTTLGVEGIAAKTGRDLLVADTAHEFAQQVSALLADAERRRTLGSAGYALARQHYDWTHILGDLEDVYRQALARRSSAADRLQEATRGRSPR
jgi:sugar transferase (PEP-CTERM/EpsH1 system associated)